LEIQAKALAEWKSLQQNEKPRILIGTATCGRAAGALEVLEAFNRELAQIGRGKVASKDMILAKPRTFINLSGEVVALLVRKFGISLSDLLIIYDDFDLPLGKIRIRECGSAGGHNGMKSIISHLGSQDFPRIRVGIAPQEENISPSSFKTPEFVLSEFTSEEKPVVDKACVRASEAIFFILSEGIITGMNKYN
jgi:PTH1 family peptidyl-tRNA hydrolase